MKSLLLFCPLHGDISSEVAAVSEDCATSRGTSCFSWACIATQRDMVGKYITTTESDLSEKNVIFVALLSCQMRAVHLKSTCKAAHHAMQSPSVLLLP